MTKYSRARLFIEVGLNLHAKGRLWKEVPDTDENRRRLGFPERPTADERDEAESRDPRTVAEDDLILKTCGRSGASGVTSPGAYWLAEWALYYCCWYTDRAGLKKLRARGWKQKDPRPELLKSGW